MPAGMRSALKPNAPLIVLYSKAFFLRAYLARFLKIWHAIAAIARESPRAFACARGGRQPGSSLSRLTSACVASNPDVWLARESRPRWRRQQSRNRGANRYGLHQAGRGRSSHGRNRAAQARAADL